MGRVICWAGAAGRVSKSLGWEMWAWDFIRVNRLLRKMEKNNGALEVRLKQNGPRSWSQFEQKEMAQSWFVQIA